MQKDSAQSASATGTTTDTLTSPVGDLLGSATNAKLDALLKSALMSEPSEQASTPPAEATETVEEETVEPTSEEPAADAEATKDTNDLSQEQTEENAESSDSDDAESEEPADLPKGVKKKLSKLSAAKRELEEQVAAKDREIEALKTRPAEPTEAQAKPLPDSPYLHLQTQAAVEQEIAQARKVRRWCEENLEGATVADPKTGKETEYTAEQIRNIRLNAVDALEEHLPRQLNYVQTKTRLDPQAETTYPFWKDRTSRDYNIAQNMLKTFPELQKFPDYKLVVGDYIRGAAAREAEAAKKLAPVSAKPVVKKAPAQPNKPSASPAPVDSKTIKGTMADAVMRKKPSQESLKKVLIEKFL